MARFAYDLNPVQHLVADAVGEPGKRTFFLQGRSGSTTVSLVMEKGEVANLAISILQLLEELEEKYPDLPPVPTRKGKGKAIKVEQPVEPAFRVGQLIVGYDEDEDMVWVIAKAMVLNEEGNLVDPSSDDAPAVRFVATREQVRALSDHALEVVAKGRPTCPLCGRPIDREGHFCPRSDGQAMPIIL